jgi:pimeloyl-ACP methyl ester carboxylesterase
LFIVYLRENTSQKMKNSVLLLFYLFSATVASAQNFAIGHLTASTTDPSRSRTITMEVYYPADVAGNNVAFTQQPITTPILVFGHGFVMTWDAYANIWQSLVPHGYLIAFATTETGFSPSHLNFGKDLAYIVSYLESEAGNPTSVFYNRLDSVACVMGHSMGGGAAFLAAQYQPDIVSMVTFAAAETTPSAIAAAASITIPSLVIAGGNDCVAPPAAHQLPMYNALAGTCKAYVSINGASHCQMAETNALCSFGEATCLPTAAISRAVQHTIIDRYMIPWLDFHFRSDCPAGLLFDNTLASDPDVTYQRTCLLCSTTAVAESGSFLTTELFPNPVDNVLHVRFTDDRFASGGTLVVTDLQGRNVTSLVVEPETKRLEIPTADWPVGTYFIHFIQLGERTASQQFSVFR